MGNDKKLTDKEIEFLVSSYERAFNCYWIPTANKQQEAAFAFFKLIKEFYRPVVGHADVEAKELQRAINYACNAMRVGNLPTALYNHETKSE